jgi:hypothetical protein
MKATIFGHFLFRNRKIKLRAQFFWKVTMCRWVSGSRHFVEIQCLRNVGKHSPHETQSHPKTLEYTTTISWEFRTSQNQICLNCYSTALNRRGMWANNVSFTLASQKQDKTVACTVYSSMLKYLHFEFRSSFPCLLVVLHEMLSSYEKDFPHNSKTLSLMRKLLTPFQSNFSATCIFPSSYLFWAEKRLVGYL